MQLKQDQTVVPKDCSAICSKFWTGAFEDVTKRMGVAALARSPQSAVFFGTLQVHSRKLGNRIALANSQEGS